MTLTEPQARDLVARAIRRISPEADVDGVADDADLRRTFELDSLDFLGFVELLVQETGLRLDEEDYPELATMASCQRLLTGRSAARPGG